MPRARWARSAAPLLVLAAVLLAGCDGGGEQPDTAATSSPTDGTEDVGASTGDAGGGDDGGGSPAEPAPPPTEPADIDLAVGDRSASQDGGTITVEGERRAAFVTPSGNIVCVMNGPSATCQLLDKTYTANPDHLLDSTTGDCGIDAADAMVISDAGGAWTCPPEPLAPTAAASSGGWWGEQVDAPTTGVGDVDASVLEYGLTLQVGGTTCLSAEDGVTCRSTDLGRQIFIARAAYRFGALQ